MRFTGSLNRPMMAVWTVNETPQQRLGGHRRMPGGGLKHVLAR